MRPSPRLNSYAPPMPGSGQPARIPTRRGSLIGRGENPWSISPCSSDSCSSACSSSMSACPTGCSPCSMATVETGRTHMKFIYFERVSSVEFLWRSGPLSRRHETVPSLSPAHERRRRAPNGAASSVACDRDSSDVRLPVAWRGAGRDRPDPGRASGRSACGHAHPSSVRYRIGANRQKPAVSFCNRPLQNDRAPTTSICETQMVQIPDSSRIHLKFARRLPPRLKGSA